MKIICSTNYKRKHAIGQQTIIVCPPMLCVCKFASSWLFGCIPSVVSVWFEQGTIERCLSSLSVL